MLKPNDSLAIVCLVWIDLWTFIWIYYYY